MCAYTRGESPRVRETAPAARLVIYMLSSHPGKGKSGARALYKMLMRANYLMRVYVLQPICGNAVADIYTNCRACTSSEVLLRRWSCHVVLKKNSFLIFGENNFNVDIFLIQLSSGL